MGKPSIWLLIMVNFQKKVRFKRELFVFLLLQIQNDVVSQLNVTRAGSCTELYMCDGFFFT